MQAGHRHHPIPLTCISGGKSNISSIEIEALLFGFSGAACWNRGRVPYLDLLAADSGNKKLYILELPSLFDCDLTERQAGAFQEEIFFGYGPSRDGLPVLFTIPSTKRSCLLNSFPPFELEYYLLLSRLDHGLQRHRQQ